MRQNEAIRAALAATLPAAFLVAACVSSSAFAATPANKSTAADAPAQGAAPAAKAPAKKGGDKVAAPVKITRGPLPGNPRWAHAPYEDGDCGLCHERNDAKNPGKITGPVNELCYSCHDEYEKFFTTVETDHPPARKNCANCHNAHNSTEPKLLLAEMTALCFTCHDDLEPNIKGAPVDHAPVVKDGRKCMNCHEAHGSNIESLLVAMPFDLCVNCHGKDDMKDSSGKAMSNIKKILADSPKHHEPIQKKDCTACHRPHGGKNFRLLVDAYPAEFYAPYEAENYALCFECHKKELVLDKETTTLTRFRDGSRNLHYLHVNNPERGRTCRACHEVHAANQPHIIRDAVPYGSRGWMLKINYEPKPTGGSCAKTCHGVKTYDNGSKVRVAGDDDKRAAPAAAGKARNASTPAAKRGGRP